MKLGHSLFFTAAVAALSCSTSKQAGDSKSRDEAATNSTSADITAPHPEVPTQAAALPTAVQPTVQPVSNVPAVDGSAAAAAPMPAAVTAPQTAANGVPKQLSNVVAFHIPAGTGTKAWNSPSTPINLKAGQTLQVTNDDSRIHWIHTNGTPFFHPFSGIQPGQTVSYQANSDAPSQVFDHTTFGAIYMSAK